MGGARALVAVVPDPRRRPGHLRLAGRIPLPDHWRERRMSFRVILILAVTETELLRTLMLNQTVAFFTRTQCTKQTLLSTL